MGNLFANIFNNLFIKRKTTNILMFGLRDAGKTSILHRLKLGNIVMTTIPIIGISLETVEYKNITFTAWDLVAKRSRYINEEAVRQWWRQRFQNTHAFIFVVDSNDRDLIDEARYGLHDMLEEDKLREIPILIFANKKDLPNAMKVQEITEKLDLESLRNQKWHIESTCAANADGLYEGLDWLSNQLNNTK